MMLVTVILLVILCICVMVYFFLWIRWLMRLPPGPWPLPFIGNIIPKDVHPTLQKWYKALADKYGPVFTVHNGSEPVVIVNGYEGIHELLVTNGQSMSLRYRGSGILGFLYNNKGVIWNNENFRQLRKVVLEGIKGSASNKDMTSAAAMTDQINILKRKMALAEMEDKPVDLAQPLRCLVAGDLLRMLFGPDLSEQASDRFIQLHYQLLGLLSKADLVLRMPFLKYVPGDKFRWKEFLTAKSEMEKLICKKVGEHWDTLPTDGSSRDFLDAYLRHSKLVDHQQPGGGDCIATVMQLMLAGLDSIHGTFMWLFLYLTILPDVQEKVLQEISMHIGFDIEPKWRDHLHMPYTDAVINETIRISNIAFTSLPYESNQPITIGGKEIPANTSIVANLVSLHKSPRHFEEPEKFRPERFLCGSESRKLEHFMPFSRGKRSCIGESFSKEKIFVTAVSILQIYKLEQVLGHTYTTECQPSFLSIPQQYSIALTRRAVNR